MTGAIWVSPVRGVSLTTWRAQEDSGMRRRGNTANIALQASEALQGKTDLLTPAPGPVTLGLEMPSAAGRAVCSPWLCLLLWRRRQLLEGPLTKQKPTQQPGSRAGSEEVGVEKEAPAPCVYTNTVGTLLHVFLLF